MKYAAAEIETINTTKTPNATPRPTATFVCFFEETGEVEVSTGEAAGCPGDGGVRNGGRSESGKLAFGVINAGRLLGGGAGGRGADAGASEGGDRAANFLSARSCAPAPNGHLHDLPHMKLGL